MPDKLLAIWGASGHALVIADIVRLVGGYQICGFISEFNSVHPRASRQGVPVFRDRECLRTLQDQGLTHVVIGIGDCRTRLALADWLAASGLQQATAIHPRAIVAADVGVGAGTVIVAGAVVNPGATIGESVIINTCASVDHDCRIEDGAHVCPGVRLAGGVTVGRAAWVGIGSTVKEGIRIGRGAMVAAGAVVVKDVPDGMLVQGVPARIVREITLPGGG